MSAVTLKQFAEIIGISVDRLLAQLQEAGLEKAGPDETITDADRLQLLQHLRRIHGRADDGGEPTRIVLPRKTINEVRIPGKPSRPHTGDNTTSVESSKRSTHPEVAKPASNEFAQKKQSSEISREITGSDSIPYASVQALRKPRVFVSYAWESKEHQVWVKELARKLRSDGVDAVLDSWALHPGDLVTEFMDKSISECDFVLIVCTRKYREKGNARTGGVGYEGTVITNEMYQKSNHRKFIPIMRGTTWSDSSPTWLQSKLYLNFSTEKDSQESYRDLLITLYGRRMPPPLGEPPSDLFEPE